MSGAPILIAGPTASGKSAFAMALAAHVGGVVVNADAMQVYAEAPILTAQPSINEQKRAPHRLYGHVSGREAYSAGRYAREVQAVVRAIAASGQTAIIVGGTGLYFKALLEGLSPVPPIPPAVRARCRALAEVEGVAGVRAALEKVDPAMAVKLDAADSQRLVRALEVYEATGTPLSVWQLRPGTPAIDAARAVTFVIDRARDTLHLRADQRFDAMMAAGALDEVRSLADLRLAPELPLMRALGVRPLLDHLDGKLSRSDAMAAAKLETRQYIKRQQTWNRRQMMSWTRISAQQMENPAATFDAIIRIRN